ncbi:MAG: glycerol kinase GlpK, partial [Bacillota bacterium]
MPEKGVLAVDQGTTGSRAVVFDNEGNIRARAYREIKQIVPRPGWVEHDPREYVSSVRECIVQALDSCGNDIRIEAVGITNQRETTIAWDKRTGEPVYNAIVWQCRRTARYCEHLIAQGAKEVVLKKTGLPIDAYFSATKIRWVLDNIPEARSLAAQGHLAVGNVDSWLMWNMTEGKVHATDVSNASRTMLFNIHTLQWDKELLNLLDIPLEILPVVRASSGTFGEISEQWGLLAGTPISGIAGDQQAALFGQTCFEPGTAKNTYGTALAVMMNTGVNSVESTSGLTTDLAWSINGATEYALEGVVFIGGAAVQWLRDGLKMIKDASETEALARIVDDTGGVYFVPAFVGLCAPYWDMYARGTI